jgi:hypothetical protein
MRFGGLSKEYVQEKKRNEWKMISASHHNIIGMKFLGWDWDRDRKKQKSAFLPSTKDQGKKKKYECVNQPS